MKIDTLDRNLVLQYLGYRGGKIGASMNEAIDRCIESTLAAAAPKAVFNRFALKKDDDGILLRGTNIFLEGNDIVNLLDGCDGAYVLCTTIGFEVERIIRRLMVESPAEGLIMDSCASAAIERVTDYANCAIDRECAVRGERTTVRYSPGYGDLPLTVQKNIIEGMACYKRIGLGLTDSMMLTPGKSVTAIIGVIK